MPNFYMLIGVPASGKSTWLKQNMSSDGVVISSDNHIEAAAAAAGKTYNDVFKQEINGASAKLLVDLKDAIAADMDIYWDQTNLTVKSRGVKLAKIPDHYKKVAVVFPTPDKEEHQRRLAGRPGKTIPPHIMASMMDNFEMPDLSEGFDEIEVVK